MTEMQTVSPTCGRLVVGHPFNPPYLIPLVEVVGGEHTAAAVEWAAEFSRHIGKTEIKMTREVPGFFANRLQEALWREVSAGGRPISELVSERDAKMIAIMRAMQAVDDAG